MALETSWLGAAGGQGCVFLAWWSSGLGVPWQVSCSEEKAAVSGKLLRSCMGSSGESLDLFGLPGLFGNSEVQCRNPCYWDRVGLSPGADPCETGPTFPVMVREVEVFT